MVPAGYDEAAWYAVTGAGPVMLSTCCTASVSPTIPRSRCSAATPSSAHRASGATTRARADRGAGSSSATSGGPLPSLDKVRWLLDKAREHLDKTAPIEAFDDLLRDGDGGEGSDLVAFDLLLFLDGWWARFVDARWAVGDRLQLRSVTPGPMVASCGSSGSTAVDAPAGATFAMWVSGRVYVVEASPSFDGVERERPPSARRLLPVPDDRWFGSGVVRVVSLSERAGILAALRPPTTSAAVMAACCSRPTKVRSCRTPRETRWCRVRCRCA